MKETPLGYFPQSKKTKYGLPMEAGAKSEVITADKALFELFAGLSVLNHLDQSTRAEVFDLAEQVRNFLADYTLAACLGESRHVLTTSEGLKGSFLDGSNEIPHNLRYLPDWHDEYRSIMNEGPTRNSASRSLWNLLRRKHLTKELAYKWLIEVFSKIQWPSSYGGRPWATIAVLGLEALNAKGDPVKTILAIDKIAHACHCGCTFINSSKFQWAFFGHGSFIIRLMNFKRIARPCCYLAAAKGPGDIYTTRPSIKSALKSIKNTHCLDPCCTLLYSSHEPNGFKFQGKLMDSLFNRLSRYQKATRRAYYDQLKLKEENE